jgi:adenylate cyclase
VKNLGDGLMAVFASATDAVDAAIAIQLRAAGRVERGEEPLDIRVGVHVGEPVLRDGDYFGRPVAVARRLCDVAGGQEILVSDVVRAVTRSTERYVERRRETLKGMTEPTTMWRVDWRELPPGTGATPGS